MNGPSEDAIKAMQDAAISISKAVDASIEGLTTESSARVAAELMKVYRAGRRDALARPS